MILINVNDTLHLRDIKLSGKIWINSSSVVILDSTSVVNNCIIRAKEIYIRSGFKGKGQFFATDKLILDDGVFIMNPSVLCVWNPASVGSISIADNCKVYADILANSNSVDKIPVLNVDESLILGQIYCNGMMQFKGILYGSLYANYLVYLDHYFPVENHVYSCCIDFGRLPKEYVGISLFDPYLNRKYAETIF